MKHLFQLFRSSDLNSENQNVLPALPTDLSKDDLRQKAMIGWIARRVGQLLSLQRDEMDLLFYKAFSYHPESNEKNQCEYFLYLSELLVEWEEKHENVFAKIKNMNLDPKLEACFIKVYVEYREQQRDVNSLSPSDHFEHRQNQSSINQTSANDRNWNEKVWQVYRDVMFAATQRKFLLISSQEVQEYLKGTMHLEEEVKERSDITRCRENAKQVFLQLGYAPSDIMSRLLLISEAVTNILKHAEYGKMYLVEDGQDVRVIIEDKGPGFSITDLPNTILLAGYSTRKSLGQGFTLMLKMSEQVLLSTNSKGSTIILVFKRGVKK